MAAQRPTISSTTHGLTAKRWINDSEQELFDAIIQALNKDFDSQKKTQIILS